MSDDVPVTAPVAVAVVQLCAGADRQANRSAAETGIREAADRGAEVVCLPEMWPFIGSDADKVAGAEELTGPSVSAMQELARELVHAFTGATFSGEPRHLRRLEKVNALEAAG